MHGRVNTLSGTKACLSLSSDALQGIVSHLACVRKGAFLGVGLGLCSAFGVVGLGQLQEGFYWVW